MLRAGVLYLPIIVLIVFSFNDSRTLTLPLSGFTLDWYEKVASNTDLLAAIGNSIYVATFAVLVTLIIGIPRPLPSTGSTFRARQCSAA